MMLLLGKDQLMRSWNSSLAQNRQISVTLEGERGSWHLMTKESDIIAMEQVGFIGLFSQFTDALASENTVTFSALKPVLEHIKTEILVQSNEDTPLITEMKRMMRGLYILRTYSICTSVLYLESEWKKNRLRLMTGNISDISLDLKHGLRIISG